MYFHLWFSTLIGIFPFTSSGRFSWKYAAYSSLILAGGFYEVIAFQHTSFYSDDIQTMRVGWLIFGLIDFKRKLVVVMSAVHFYKLIRNRTTVLEIYRLSGAPDNSLPFAFTLAALIVKFGIEWGLYDFVNNIHLIRYSLIMFHMNLTKATILLQFCGFLKNFHCQLDDLYAAIRTQKVTNVSALVDRHAQILSHMKQSNDIYSHQILSGCVVYGEYMIVNLLRLIVGFMNNQLILDLIHRAFATLFYFIILTYLSARCQRTMEKANEFNTEMFKLMRNNNELHCNDKLLLYVKMKQTVQFSACGFFALGFPLLTSIMAVVTTYLVILLQFSLPNQ